MVAAVFASTLLSVVLAGSPESYLKFPPDHREDLLTHFVCELPPESEVGMYGMPLSGSSYRLEYRKRWFLESFSLSR